MCAVAEMVLVVWQSVFVYNIFSNQKWVASNTLSSSQLLVLYFQTLINFNLVDFHILHAELYFIVKSVKCYIRIWNWSEKINIYFSIYLFIYVQIQLPWVFVSNIVRCQFGSRVIDDVCIYLQSTLAPAFRTLSHLRPCPLIIQSVCLNECIEHWGATIVKTA